METFLTVKTNENPQGRVTQQELEDLLKIDNISKLNEDIKKLDTKVKKLESTLNKPIDYYSIISDTLIKNKVLTLGTPININFVSSIELDDTINVGTVYRDSINDRLRIKMNTGWKTITLT